jgi:RNA-splicing ligase RtcB
MKGKYNVAKVMIDEIDSATKEQIQEFLNQPMFANCNIVIMPDCHAGKGSCVGYTQTMNDYIIPNIIGVDIGCGVTSVRLMGSINLDNISKVDSLIKRNIPMGSNVYKTIPNETLKCLEGWSNPFGLNNALSENIYLDSEVDYVLRSLGTLGGGNHFIEIGVDSSGYYWLTVHSGSRKYGKDICENFQNEAYDFNKKVFSSISSKDVNFLFKNNSNYLQYMNEAYRYARVNRILIINAICNLIMEHDYLELYPSIRIYSNEFYDLIKESIHNYIDEDNIIRKGAVSANKDEDVIIPLNMEDGIIIGKGKGNKNWNYSAPHGAGRVLSRMKAKEQLNLDEAISSMKSKGVYTTSLTKNTLDEVKGAYKDKELIVNAINDTVEIIDYIKPILNIKAQH